MMENSVLKTSYGTLSQTIHALANLGYNHDFNIQNDCLVCHRAQVSLKPDDFQIDQVYRFDGDSDPDYQAILYAISSPIYKVKGVLVNGYGLASDEKASKLIEKLEIHQKTNQIKIKANEATHQRPEGDRLIDAPLVELNIPASILQIKNESTWHQSDRNSITLFKSSSMRIVLIGLRAQAEMKPHKASGQLSVQVIEGEIIFATDTQQVNLKVGQMVSLHENIAHSVEAVEDSFILLTLAMPNH